MTHTPTLPAELVEEVATAIRDAYDAQFSDERAASDYDFIPCPWDAWEAEATAALSAPSIVAMREALVKIAEGRTIRFTGSEHPNRPLRNKDAQNIARAALTPKPADSQLVEVVAMLSAAVSEEGCTIFDHSAEEIGLEVMENHAAILAALSPHMSSSGDAERVSGWASPTLGRAYEAIANLRSDLAAHPESSIDESLCSALEAIELADTELVGIAS